MCAYREPPAGFDAPPSSLLPRAVRRIGPPPGEVSRRTVRAIQFSPDGRHLVLVDDGGGSVYDASTGALVDEIGSIHASFRLRNDGRIVTVNDRDVLTVDGRRETSHDVRGVRGWWPGIEELMRLAGHIDPEERIVASAIDSVGERVAIVCCGAELRATGLELARRPADRPADELHVVRRFAPGSCQTRVVFGRRDELLVVEKGVLHCIENSGALYSLCPLGANNVTYDPARHAFWTGPQRVVHAGTGRVLNLGVPNFGTVHLPALDPRGVYAAFSLGWKIEVTPVKPAKREEAQLVLYKFGDRTTCRIVLPGDGLSLALAFSPDGARLVGGTTGRCAYEWVLDDLRDLFEPPIRRP